MAEPKRDFVWLECVECAAKNYRTERKVKLDMKKASKKPPAAMNNNRLELKKFCRGECKRHTLHRESRKK